MQRLGTAGDESGGHLETGAGDAFSGRPGSNTTIATQRTPDSLDGLQ